MGLLVAAAVAITTSLATTFAVVTSASASTLRSQILGGYIAYLNNLNIEVQSLARHGVVEVHLNALLGYLLNDTVHAVTLSVAHWDNVAYDEQLLGQLAVNHEN